VNGVWRCEKEHLQPLCRRAQELVAALAAHRFQWVPRASNARADALANRAMDERRSFSCVGGSDDAGSGGAIAAGRKRLSGDCAGGGDSGGDDDDVLPAAKARRTHPGRGGGGT
jgi:hypothetical protein